VALRLRAYFVILWVFLSPGLARAQWSAIGPSGGGAHLLAASHVQPGTLVAGTRNALLYRSSDQAATWQPIPFDRSFTATLNALIPSPCNPEMFYAGTGDPDPAHAGIYTIARDGVSWNIRLLFQGEDVMSLAISPKDCRVMAAGTVSGVMLSRDAGSTWRRIAPAGDMELQPIVSLVFAPDSTQSIYAGTPRLPWKTSDGGQTWRPIHVGIYDDSDIFSIVVENDRLLIGACSGIYKSGDGGVLWKKVLGIPGESRRTYVVKPALSDPRILYAGTSNGLWKSVDAGVTWIRKSALPARSIVIDTRNSRDIVVATEVGIWKSSDGGDTLTPANTGFVNRRLGAFLDVGNSLLATSVYDVGFGSLFATKDGGKNWSARSGTTLFGEHIFHLARTPNAILGAGLQHLFRSSDDGKSWTGLPLTFKGTLTDFTTVGQTRTMLVATTTALYAARDDGSESRQIKIPAAITRIDAIKTSFSGGAWGILSNGRVFLSEDQGNTWSQLPVPEATGSVYDFVLRENREILIGTLRGLLYSFDFGAGWLSPSRGPATGTVTSVLWHPVRSQLMFLVQDGVVWESEDFGVHWDPSPSSTGAEAVSSLKWGFNYERLYALDFARGVSVRNLSGFNK